MLLVSGLSDLFAGSSTIGESMAHVLLLAVPNVVG